MIRPPPAPPPRWCAATSTTPPPRSAARRASFTASRRDNCDAVPLLYPNCCGARGLRFGPRAAVRRRAVDGMAGGSDGRDALPGAPRDPVPRVPAVDLQAGRQRRSIGGYLRALFSREEGPTHLPARTGRRFDLPSTLLLAGYGGRRPGAGCNLRPNVRDAGVGNGVRTDAESKQRRPAGPNIW